ncbi:MAG: PD-(D/E)XK nuclease family protein, partial [Planctomycetales bacterium]|nr:PD-(D/E)XK nuclease family protein [Planctomycetales bacterium]
SASELRRFAVAGALDESPALLAALLAAPATAEGAQAVAAGLECVGSRAVRDGFGAWEGVLGSDAAQAEFARRFGSEHLWSPSQLESYALCPFKFFGEQVLGLRPAPELVLESDFGRRGVMLHETLAALHRQRAAERDETQTVADTPEQLAALRDELVAEYRQALAALAGRAPRTGLDAALWEIERRQIDSWAEQLSDQELSYRGYYADWDVPPEPRYFEARFGPGSRRSESAADAELTTDEPYRLQLAQEQLRLTGQIDRIDVGRVAGRTAFNVIDYKTSAKAAVKPDQVADGRQLQLPLYAMAAQELLLAAQDAVAWSAGYWSVQGKGLGKPGNKSGPLQVSARGDSELVTDAAWGATQDRLRERVAEIVAGIRRAEFPVFSADEHCTSYCPLRTTCRIAHVRSLQKTWHGAAMAEGEENGE